MRLPVPAAFRRSAPEPPEADQELSLAERLMVGREAEVVDVPAPRRGMLTWLKARRSQPATEAPEEGVAPTLSEGDAAESVAEETFEGGTAAIEALLADDDAGPTPDQSADANVRTDDAETELIVPLGIDVPTRRLPLLTKFIGSRSREQDELATEPVRVATTAEDVRRQAFGDTTPGELIAEEITAWFGDHKVLDRVSLDMRAGQVTALIGPSGCGKSTFLRILNRMHEMIPTAKLHGRVLLDGQDLYAPDQRLTRARRQVGMVFQKPNPFPADSIYDNVVSGFALSGMRLSRTERDLIVEDSLRKASLWDEVKDRLEQKAGGLSGGQQQRLCIARSLAVSPRVLLMDEPCSALDPTSTLRVEETIEALKGGTTTIVIVTHNMQQARRISDRTAFFLASQNTPGVIVEYGQTESMFESPQSEDTWRYVNGKFG